MAMPVTRTGILIPPRTSPASRSSPHPVTPHEVDDHRDDGDDQE